MKVRVVGKEKMEGTSKKTGNPYNGSLVHIAFAKPRCEGNGVESLFVDNSLAKYENIRVDKLYDLDRDGRGYILAFEEVK